MAVARVEVAGAAVTVAAAREAVEMVAEKAAAERGVVGSAAEAREAAEMGEAAEAVVRGARMEAGETEVVGTEVAGPVVAVVGVVATETEKQVEVGAPGALQQGGQEGRRGAVARAVAAHGVETTVAGVRKAARTAGV